MDIETLGVNAVKEIMQFNPYIDTRYIKEGDKYPSFDGEILIYNNKAGKKNGLNRVYTQIKTQFSSSFENEISYMIECVDLENYMNLGGCLYFVVRYNSVTRQKVVYYKLIYPIIAKDLLSKKKVANQKSISVKFKVFPNNDLEQSDLLLNFAIDCIKQTSFAHSCLLDNDFFKTNQKYEISYSTYENKISDPWKYFLKNEVFAYRLTEDGDKIPFNTITLSQVNEPVNAIVTVDGAQYYEKYIIVTTKDQLPKFLVNQSFSFIFDSLKREITYICEIKGSLKARINDLRFLSAAIKNNGFEINGYKLKLDSEIKTISEDIANQLVEYEQIQEALSVAGVKDDLDFDRLTKNDLTNLMLLKKIFLKKEPITCINKNGNFLILRIGNIVIPLYVEKDESMEEKYKAVNVFDAGIVIGQTEQELRNGNFSVYCTILSLKELEEFSNIDFEKFYHQITNAALTEFHLKQTNDFLLQVILYYDKYKAEDAYFFAQRIAEWLKKYEDDDNYIFVINYLQLKIRKRALTIDEMSKLIEIYKQTNRNDIKFGCLILLNRQEEAMNYFNLLNKDEQNALRELPIYKFVER